MDKSKDVVDLVLTCNCCGVGRRLDGPCESCGFALPPVMMKVGKAYYIRRAYSQYHAGLVAGERARIAYIAEHGQEAWDKREQELIDAMYPSPKLAQ